MIGIRQKPVTGLGEYCEIMLHNVQVRFFYCLGKPIGAWFWPADLIFYA